MFKFKELFNKVSSKVKGVKFMSRTKPLNFLGDKPNAYFDKKKN